MENTGARNPVSCRCRLKREKETLLYESVVAGTSESPSELFSALSASDRGCDENLSVMASSA